MIHIFLSALYYFEIKKNIFDQIVVIIFFLFGGGRGFRMVEDKEETEKEEGIFPPYFTAPIMNSNWVR